MIFPKQTALRMLAWSAAVGLGAMVVWLAAAAYGQAPPVQQPAAPSSAARPVGTVKAITGNAVTVTTDSGAEVRVLVQESTRMLRVAPGQKDLKDAPAIQLQEVQPGDRMIIRGRVSDDGKSVMASSIMVMRRADIAERQEHEREDWQKRGVGGLVRSIDPASGTITLLTSASAPNKTITVRVSKDTIVRRYAPESVKFEDAQPGTLEQIKPGDQLRARGARSVDGGEISAEEIVSGSFRNIAGTITSVDPGASTISLMDLLTKKPVSVKITADSQLKQLPPMVAQRIAMRMKGASPDTGAANGAGNPPAAQKTDQASSDAGGSRPRGAADLQQMLGRLPAVTLADLHKGDAVMMVTTEDGVSGPNAITLLTGVEPILTASPNGEGAAMLLSPWTLGGPSAGDAASQ